MVYEIFGVVGMVFVNFKEGLLWVLGCVNVFDGVVIGKDGGKFIVDFYIVVVYGVNIFCVVENIIEWV